MEVNYVHCSSFGTEMSSNFEDEETDCLLAEVNENEIEFVEERHPWLLPRSSDAAQAPAKEVINGTQRVAPQDLSGGELRRREGLARGPLLLFQLWKTSFHLRMVLKKQKQSRNKAVMKECKKIALHLLCIFANVGYSS